MSYLRFTKSHEWLDTEHDEMTVGITDHAQDLLGDMVYVELPPVGKDVKAGDEIGVLESVKAASDFYAPISGVIVSVNKQVAENPSFINTDPYGAGWLVKIKAHLAEKAFEEISDMIKEEQYISELSEDI